MKLITCGETQEYWLIKQEDKTDRVFSIYKRNVFKNWSACLLNSSEKNFYDFEGIIIRFLYKGYLEYGIKVYGPNERSIISFDENRLVIGSRTGMGNSIESRLQWEVIKDKNIIDSMEYNRIEYLKNKTEFLCYTSNMKWKLVKIDGVLYFDRKDKNGNFGNFNKVVKNKYYLAYNENNYMNECIVYLPKDKNIVYYFMGGSFYKRICSRIFALALQPLCYEENELLKKISV